MRRVTSAAAAIAVLAFAAPSPALGAESTVGGYSTDPPRLEDPGDPLPFGGYELELVAAAGGVLVLGGLGIRRLAHR